MAKEGNGRARAREDPRLKGLQAQAKRMSGGSWTQKEVTHGSTRFIFNKMYSLEGWYEWDQIRAMLGMETAESLLSMFKGTLTRDDLQVGLIVRVLALSHEVMDDIRRRMFRTVDFANERARSPQVLLGAEEMAFDGLSPLKVYDVMLRAMAVNFQEFSDGLRSD